MVRKIFKSKQKIQKKFLTAVIEKIPAKNSVSPNFTAENSNGDFCLACAHARMHARILYNNIIKNFNNIINSINLDGDQIQRSFKELNNNIKLGRDQIQKDPKVLNIRDNTRDLCSHVCSLTLADMLAAVSGVISDKKLPKGSFAGLLFLGIITSYYIYFLQFAGNNNILLRARARTRMRVNAHTREQLSMPENFSQFRQFSNSDFSDFPTNYFGDSNSAKFSQNHSKNSEIILDYYVKKFREQKIYYNPRKDRDLECIKELLVAGIPPERIIAGIDIFAKKYSLWGIVGVPSVAALRGWWNKVEEEFQRRAKKNKKKKLEDFGYESW